MYSIHIPQYLGDSHYRSVDTLTEAKELAKKAHSLKGLKVVVFKEYHFGILGWSIEAYKAVYTAE